MYNNVQLADAIGLSLPPAPVVRVQPSYEHPSEVKIASTVNKRSDKVRLMPSKEIIPLIYLNAQHVYVNEKILKRLRAGGFEETLVLIAIGVVVFLTFQLSGTDAFAILNQLGRINAPSVNPRFGLTVNPTSTEIALVPTQAQEFNDMALKFNEPKPNFNFVRTRDAALKLIKETYPGQLEITANERMSDWQAAKKIYMPLILVLIQRIME